MEKIAIIGMGISGMAVALAYEKELDINNIEIDCYDNKNSFGKGYPYREDSEKVLLNLKTKKISYDYEKPEDFYNWHIENNIPVVDYASRARFGNYTNDRLASTLKYLNANIIEDEVSDIEYIVKENKWKLITNDNQFKLYDRIHLCSGELPQKDIYNLSEYKNYINSVYPLNKTLNNIKKEDTVTVLGTGLTGVDIASYLIDEKDIDKINIYSRTNIIPTVRVAPVEAKVNILDYDSTMKLIEDNNGYMSFETFDNLFLRELASHNINYEKFLEIHMSDGVESLKNNIKYPDELAIIQAILPPLNLILNEIWLAFTESDRILFKEKHHKFIAFNRSPLPLESAEILIKAYDEGRLILLENIIDINFDKNTNEFIIHHGDSTTNSKWIVNGTGVDISLDNLENDNQLISKLLDKRYIQRDSFGGVSVLAKDVSVISPKFGHLKNFHAHGILISGVQYRNNSTLIIQKTAHDLIKNIY